MADERIFVLPYNAAAYEGNGHKILVKQAEGIRVIPFIVEGRRIKGGPGNERRGWTTQTPGEVWSFGKGPFRIGRRQILYSEEVIEQEVPTSTIVNLPLWTESTT